MNVGVLEAKNRFSELIEAAERGEDVVITRRGEPTVKLTPVGSEAERIADGLKALEEMRQLGRKIRQRIGRDLTWEELKADRDFGRP